MHDGDDVHSKSSTDDCRQTQESTDHLDRKAGSLGASRTTALFSFEGTNLALVRRFVRSTTGELVFERPLTAVRFSLGRRFQGNRL